MSSLGLVGALVVGAAFGYGAQRGAFCMNSGFRGAFEGDWTKVKALGLAVALQLLLLPAIFATRLARPAQLPLLPVAAVLGGLLFGFSMRWADGCAAGVCYKLGAGDIGALLAILGMALGVLIGGWLAARRGRPITPSVPSSADLSKRFAGGLGLGIGASVATGCTVGQGLTGLALLAPSSFVVMAAIFGGSAVSTLLARRPRSVSRPAISSSTSP